jgi:hypothetical protein
MTLTSLIIRASETAGSSSSVHPLYVGLGIFIFLAALLVALLAFGAGREHS